MKLSSVLLLALSCAAARAEDGYRLWLRYDRIGDGAQRAAYASALPEVSLCLTGGAYSAITESARRELAEGIGGMLGTAPTVGLEDAGKEAPRSALGTEGYSIERGPRGRLRIVANGEAGLLYGAFALLREVQTRVPADALASSGAPRVELRLLDHWDNLNGTIERGYSGNSIWEWYVLPGYRTPRYRDYARACASIGINGAVLNSVNADALILTPDYLAKVAAIASDLREYGIRTYLTARFTSPMEIGGLKTADPLDPGVAAWWRRKADEIYALIPDFGGFLVKANSEGQPGPQDYHRTHAEGANVIADAVAPHGGIVMWRAFVYGAHPEIDRVNQAYDEFKPLDGKFRDNVILQLKNGPLDFQPREPFHPLFGAMPGTRTGLEVQITQEYLGASLQLAYLGPLFQEALRADTFAPGPGHTVAQIVESPMPGKAPSLMAGVSNVGNDRNWTGHPLAAANWYAFGRLAWDPSLDSADIAREWIRMTFSCDPTVVATLGRMLDSSRETVVSYSMPLGLHHLMATDYHYGPGPWAQTSRADWTPSYYHRADAQGLGSERSQPGTGALSQYAPGAASQWADPATCPENLLLWFHHVAWDHRMRSGRTLWDELCLRYQSGVDGARQLERDWASLAGLVDAQRYAHVRALLERQAADAAVWRDGCLLYFQQFSKRPLPPGVEAPAHPLAYYEAIRLYYFPGNPQGK